MRVLATGTVALMLTATGCALSPWGPGPPDTRGAIQDGVASWYGPGFHGKPTTSGEIYDQHQLTAAHQTLPLGTRVAVTNLGNGRSVEVRINDRGPFVDGRVIDLSYAAGRALDLIGPGTAPVRITVLGDPTVRFAALVYAVQVGSFADAENAARLRDRLAEQFAGAYVSEVESGSGRMYRVRLGRFAQHAAAVAAAQTVAPLGLTPVVVEDGNVPQEHP